MASEFVSFFSRFAFLSDKFVDKSLSWLQCCASVDLIRLGIEPTVAVPLCSVIRRCLRVYGSFYTVDVLCDLEDKTVFTARKIGDQGLYALKATHAHCFETFQEPRILGEISSCDRVPRLVEHGWRGSHYYIVSSPVGLNLWSYTKTHKLSKETIFDWGIQLWCSLREIHSLGVFHRDVKPDNIIVVDDHVQLIDFGGSVSDTHPSDCMVCTLEYSQPGWEDKDPAENDFHSLIFSIHAIEIGIGKWERQVLLSGVCPQVRDLPFGIAQGLFDLMSESADPHVHVIMSNMRKHAHCL